MTTTLVAFRPRRDGIIGPSSQWDFELPQALEAAEPPEARGLARDAVRLMVSYRSDNRVEHARFHEIDRFLQAGDLLVINTSGTMPAALPAAYKDALNIELHLSTHLPADLWTVELRFPGPEGSRPFYRAEAGAKLRLPAGGMATLHTPYPHEGDPTRNRLWIASLALPCSLDAYLERHGFPIRYGYVRQKWPLEYYQTVYATESGSAEMPSAGRAFTPDVLEKLCAKGVRIAPLILHTGVASLEDHEPPYEEFYRVPLETAQAVNEAKQAGRRVIAVGTTVVRALETVTDSEGTTHPGEGWTRLVITPERGIRSVTGMLTGLHEPRATHLAMLEALTQSEPGFAECGCLGDPAAIRSCLAMAGQEHLRIAYVEALREGYLWHEFGDLHLILP